MLGRNSQNELERPRVDDLGRLMVSTAGESTTTEYNIDDPSVGDEYGIITLGVRHDDEESPVSDNGDLHPMVFNSQGRLKVSTMPGLYEKSVGVLTTTAAAATNVSGVGAVGGNGYIAVDVSRASNVMFSMRNSGSVSMAAGQFAIEASLDSTDGVDGTWIGIQAVRSNANTIVTNTGTMTAAAGAGAGFGFECSVNANLWFRLRVTTNVTTNAAAEWTIIRGSYATEPIPAVQTHAVTLTSTTANIGTVASAAYTDSAANLGSAATFTGTSRDAAATVSYQTFVANVVADQDGTLYIQKSTDNATWRNAGMVAVTANTPKELIVKVTTRYNRVYYVNGAGVQTQFLLTSALQRI